MDFELILNAVQCQYSEAKSQFAAGHIPACQEQLVALLNLLIEELTDVPPEPPAPHSPKFNPEQCLVDVANAVRHRPISIHEHWKIIYYHTRICCVPVTCDCPDNIVLNLFTERMAVEGFSNIYWHQTKMNIIALYKELES